MGGGKIHFRGQLTMDRGHDEPLWEQLVRQLEHAIRSGDHARDAALPSSRELARALGVSRNTVLTAYEELKARGAIAGSQGAGMRVVTRYDGREAIARSLRLDAQYPVRGFAIADADGNPITISF